MTFTELWGKCRNGDTKACRTLHLYHYVIPHMARMFKRLNIEPPIVFPKPWPQPDPVPFERLAGEAQLFHELTGHMQISNLTAPASIQLKTLQSLKSEILDWSNEIEKDIRTLQIKASKEEHGLSDIGV